MIKRKDNVEKSKEWGIPPDTVDKYYAKQPVRPVNQDSLNIQGEHEFDLDKKNGKILLYATLNGDVRVDVFIEIETVGGLNDVLDEYYP